MERKIKPFDFQSHVSRNNERQEGSTACKNERCHSCEHAGWSHLITRGGSDDSLQEGSR
jgi:hypothetical protein